MEEVANNTFDLLINELKKYLTSTDCIVMNSKILTDQKFKERIIKEALKKNGKKV